MHMYLGGTTKGLTEPEDMEAAQQLVHLSGDEGEGDNHSRRQLAKSAGVAKASVVQSGGEVEKTTTEGKGAKEDADDGDDKGACPRKRRFRSIAYIYKVTRPVRIFDEAKRRKIH